MLLAVPTEHAEIYRILTGICCAKTYQTTSHLYAISIVPNSVCSIRLSVCSCVIDVLLPLYSFKFGVATQHPHLSLPQGQTALPCHEWTFHFLKLVNDICVLFNSNSLYSTRGPCPVLASSSVPLTVEP